MLNIAVALDVFSDDPVLRTKLEGFVQSFMEDESFTPEQITRLIPTIGKLLSSAGTYPVYRSMVKTYAWEKHLICQSILYAIDIVTKSDVYATAGLILLKLCNKF